jgi:hypothetical protein
MAELLECQKALIKARNIVQLMPYRHAKLNEQVWPGKLKESAEAVIEQELSPKKAVLDPTSKLNLGDQINGKMIEGFSTHSIPRPEVRTDSSSHRGQFSVASGFVFCRVSYIYRQIQPPRFMLTAGLI